MHQQPLIKLEEGFWFETADQIIEKNNLTVSAIKKAEYLKNKKKRKKSKNKNKPILDRNQAHTLQSSIQ